MKKKKKKGETNRNTNSSTLLIHLWTRLVKNDSINSKDDLTKWRQLYHSLCVPLFLRPVEPFISWRLDNLRLPLASSSCAFDPRLLIATSYFWPVSGTDPCDASIFSSGRTTRERRENTKESWRAAKSASETSAKGTSWYLAAKILPACSFWLAAATMSQ